MDLIQMKDTILEEVTEQIVEPVLEEQVQPAGKSIELKVLSQRGHVLLIIGEQMLQIRPEHALKLAADLRSRANGILHAQHQAEARARREKKEKRH